MYKPSLALSELCPFSLTPVERVRLTNYFILLASFLAITFLIQNQSFESTLAGLLIAFVSLIPGLLWIRGYVLGLPIFPIFAATFIHTYASPLVLEHPVASLYSTTEHLLAGAKIAMMLTLATISWLVISRRHPSISGRYRALKPQGASRLFLGILYAALFYQILLNNGSLWVLPVGINSILRALVYGLNWVAIFYLSYSWGQKHLSQGSKVLFLIGVITFIGITATSLILAQAIWNCIIALMGYALGARRLPLVLISISFLIFSILHAGKGEMRVDSWGENSTPLQILDYPGFFVTWVGYSINSLSGKGTGDELYTELLEQKSPSSLLERASLTHLFLLAQRRAEEGLPLLGGATYSIIPGQLLPRILYPGKSTPLEGTRILNIHYGLQTVQSATTYSISWGIINESFANFGLPGLLVFGILVGALFAFITSWSSFTPVLSARAFTGVIVMGIASKTEITTGTMVVSLFHNLVVLAVFAYLFMKPFSLNVSPEEIEPGEV